MASGATPGHTEAGGKFDRQLRLWGAHGQQALFDAKICVINAGPSGSETMKNLVLPGCGDFTIVDEALVSAADIGKNFFVTVDHIGQPRAKAVQEMLCEMNPDVKGKYRAESIASVLAAEPTFLSQFTLIIATEMPEKQLSQVAAIAWDQGVPLVSVRAYGLIGSVRLAVPEHCIVESKPDPVTFDLRLSDPFPELQAVADSVDIASVKPDELENVPYPVLLLKIRHAWMQSHGGALPTSTAEKDEFKQMVKALYGEATGLPLDAIAFSSDSSFKEAIDYAYKAYVPYSIDYELQELMKDEKAATLTSSSSSFWFLVAALRDFVANEGGGKLPLGGQVPDLTSTTAMFLALQRAFEHKYEADRAAFVERLKGHLRAAGLPEDHVSDFDVTNFVKNSRNLMVIRYRPLSAEYDPATAAKDDIGTELAISEHGEHAPIRWYLALRAVDRFHAANGRFPGDSDAAFEGGDDTAQVARLAGEICLELGLDSSTISSKHVEEMVRYGGTEIHNIAAIMGGLASHEAIKLVTQQFVPMNNTHVYNGIVGASATYEL